MSEALTGQQAGDPNGVGGPAGAGEEGSSSSLLEELSAMSVDSFSQPDALLSQPEALGAGPGHQDPACAVPLHHLVHGLTAASFVVPLSPKPTVFGSRRTGRLKSSTMPPDVSVEDNVPGIAGRHFSVVATGSAYRVELIALTPGYCVRATTEGGATRAELYNRGETCELQVRDMLQVANGHVFQLLPLSENGQRCGSGCGCECGCGGGSGCECGRGRGRRAGVAAAARTAHCGEVRGRH